MDIYYCPHVKPEPVGVNILAYDGTVIGVVCAPDELRTLYSFTEPFPTLDNDPPVFEGVVCFNCAFEKIREEIDGFPWYCDYACGDIEALVDAVIYSDGESAFYWNGEKWEFVDPYNLIYVAAYSVKEIERPLSKGETDFSEYFESKIGEYLRGIVPEKFGYEIITDPYPHNTYTWCAVAVKDGKTSVISIRLTEVDRI